MHKQMLSKRNGSKTNLGCCYSPFLFHVFWPLVMTASKGKNFSVVGLNLKLSNKHTKYMWVYYLPTSMFTATSWVD